MIQDDKEKHQTITANELEAAEFGMFSLKMTTLSILSLSSFHPGVLNFHIWEQVRPLNLSQFYMREMLLSK